MFNNTTGLANTAVGDSALLHNTTGNYNTATGWAALFNNTSGSGNVALGKNAGFNVTTGNNNIDIGNLGIAGDSGIIRIGTEASSRDRAIESRGLALRLCSLGAVRCYSSGSFCTARLKSNVKPSPS